MQSHEIGYYQMLRITKKHEKTVKYSVKDAGEIPLKCIYCMVITFGYVIKS